MMKRNPDGTWRNTRRPVVVSPEILRARWIESMVARMKTMGLTFEDIADQISRIGRGEAPALVPIPPGVTFPNDYTISRQSCHKAFQRALRRQPSLEVKELRKLDNARTEEMFLNLQPGIRKGNVRAIEVGIKVLEHSAKMNGHNAPQRHEVTGKDGRPITLIQILDAMEELPDEEG